MVAELSGHVGYQGDSLPKLDKRYLVGVIVAAATVKLLLNAPIASASLPRVAGLPLKNNGISGNWAGYVASPGSGVTSVSGHWTVPTAGTLPPGSLLSTWVGIGGYNTSDLIQAGTQQISAPLSSVIAGGAYGAWYELLPAGPVFFTGCSPDPACTVAPGDVMSVTISGGGSNWTIFVSDAGRWTARPGGGGGPAGGLDAWWRAANYLSVGQIYLLDNALLTEPLRAEHIKPRLLGHWGTTPGLNFIYAHLNRAILARGSRHALRVRTRSWRPGMVANTWLEGSYTDRYPSITRDGPGMLKLFRQFSFPGGIPSHAAPETPGSIHEGGELGYSLSHAYGAAFDNPDLVVACVIGDGEAETGPLAASWHSNKFLDPVHDGAVLPILHLNGWKIANPTVLARIGDDELRALLEGYGYQPHFVVGDDPDTMHRTMATTLDAILDAIAGIQRDARSGASTARPRWPMVVLRTPKGWTGPAEVDGLPSRARGAPIRFRSARSAPTATTWPCSKRGCAATGPRSCSTSTARRDPRRSRWLRPGRSGWATRRTPTAACCCATSSCPTSATTPSR